MSPQTPSTSSLLSSILTAHGGLTNWHTTTRITVKFTFWGAMLSAKGYPGPRHPTVTINPHQPPNALITNLDGDPSHKWHFSPSRVWIETSDGVLLEERHNPRASFADHVFTPVPTPWDRLHLLYFLGYAMYNYLVLPWAFASVPGFDVAELEPHREAGENWRVLEVKYPVDFPKHSRVQRFYFGEEDFMLRRMDYVAEVIGGSAAHYCFDWKSVGGLVFPTFRRVVRTVEGEARVSGRTGFGLLYEGVEVEDKEGRVDGGKGAGKG